LRSKRTTVLLLAGAALAALGASGSTAQSQQTCVPVGEPKAKEVLDGVTLSWHRSFLCDKASDPTAYAISIRITSDAGSIETVTLDRLRLSHTTPRPRGRAPEASDPAATGLPAVLAAGSGADVGATGTSTLATPGKEKKANLHLRVQGRGNDSADRFQLGITVKLRATTEDDEDEAGARGDKAQSGRPSWAGGPPPWAGAGGRNTP
jgi:hypothetical protein